MRMGHHCGDAFKVTCRDKVCFSQKKLLDTLLATNRAIMNGVPVNNILRHAFRQRTTIPTTIHLSLQRLNSRSSLNLLTWVVISSDFFPTFFFDQKQLGKLWINVFFYHRFQNNNNKISFWENEILQIFNITKLKQKKETLVLGS